MYIYIEGLNIATVGYVDAGKTTLSEAIMALSETHTDAGSVDSGTTRTDVSSIERNRGITIYTMPVEGIFPVGQDEFKKKITILDTPGHPEFRHNVGAVLSNGDKPLVDTALFLLDGTKEPSAHSKMLFDEVLSHDVSPLVVLNKIDQLRDEGQAGEMLERIIHAMSPYAKLNLFQKPVYNGRGLEGIESNGVGTGTPAFLTSATKGLGVRTLVDYVLENVRPTDYEIGDFQATILGSAPPGHLRETPVYLKVNQGNLHARSRIFLPNGNRVRIRKLADTNGDSIRRVSAGDVFYASGLESVARGSTISTSNNGDLAKETGYKPEEGILQAPIISDTPDKVVHALNKIRKSNPSYSWSNVDGRLYAHASSTFLLEILGESLQKEYGVDVKLGDVSPRYVACPINERIFDTVKGFFDSKNGGIELNMTIEGVGQTSGLEVLANKVEAENRAVGLDIGDHGQRFLDNVYWFDKFPIAGTTVKIVGSEVQYGLPENREYRKAIENGLISFLEESGSVALFEPTLKICGLLDSRQKDTSISFFNRYGIDSWAEGSKPEKENEDDPEPKWDWNVFDRLIGSSSFSNSSVVVYTVPVSTYLRMETEFLKELKEMPWSVKVGDYQRVSYDKARSMLLSSEGTSGSSDRRVERPGRNFSRRIERVVEQPVIGSYDRTLRETASPRPSYDSKLFRGDLK